jgi:raffinose/stachyose/melibiose transport system substrate-binding protein
MKLTVIAMLALSAVCLFSCGGAIVDMNDPKALAVWAENTQSSNPALSVYAKLLQDVFQKQNPESKMGWMPQKEVGPALIEKVKTALEVNNAPDIIHNLGGTAMYPSAEGERILDLTADTADIKVCEAAKSAMLWNDKTYCMIPFFSIAGLFVNETKFKELGIKIPETLTELEAAADALKAKGVQPFAADKRSVFNTYMYLVNRIGGDAFNQSLNRKLRFDTPAFIQAGQILYDWAKRGYFGTLPVAADADTATKLMSSGQIGMQVGASTLSALYDDPARTKVTIGFHPFPVITGGKGTSADILGMSEIGFVAVKKAEVKNDLVVKFMHSAMSADAAKAGAGLLPSNPDYAPTSRLLGQAAQVFYTAKNLQFYWDQELPKVTAIFVVDTTMSFLNPDTDPAKACNALEQKAQSEMGSVVD